MTVTARIGSSQGGDRPYQWEISYDDVTRRVTAGATADSHITQITGLGQITTAGATRKVQFLQLGGTADADTDFPVTIGAAPAEIGPTVSPAQVARLVGKIGTVEGGLPFTESSTHT
jgi:hypothetical protein